MMLPKRSTNERVLARHHLKRMPAHHVHVAAVNADDYANANGLDDIEHNLLPEATTIPANTVAANTLPASATTSVSSDDTVLPAIGGVTAAVPTTTVPTVTKTVSPTTVSKAVTTLPAAATTPV